MNNLPANYDLWKADFDSSFPAAAMYPEDIQLDEVDFASPALAAIEAPRVVPAFSGTPVVLAPFTKSDWYGFSGASRFEDGSAPFISQSDVSVDGEGAVVILDNDGLAVLVTVDDFDTQTVTFANAHAARALATLRSSMTMAALRALPGAVFCA